MSPSTRLAPSRAARHRGVGGRAPPQAPRMAPHTRARVLAPPFPGAETSGTASFAYGLAYGIRAGLLERATYLPVLARAWNGMVGKAVRADGSLGYVQG